MRSMSGRYRPRAARWFNLARNSNALGLQLLKYGPERVAGNSVACVNVVSARHENLWFDDRYDSGLLAESGISGERVGVRFDAATARHTGPDSDGRTPLGEAYAQTPIR